MTTTPWIPAEVLHLDLSASGFACIGYAASKGRKCRNPIAWANCEESAKILQKMSRLDPQSQRVDDKLEELASRLLCSRWHQDQAGITKSQWQCHIDDYQAAEAAPRYERIDELMELMLMAATVGAERSSTVRTPPAPAHSTVARPRVTSHRTTRTSSSVHFSVYTSFSAALSMTTQEASGGRGNNERNEEDSGQQMNRNPTLSSQREAPLRETDRGVHNLSRTPSADELTTHTPDTSPQEQRIATREGTANRRDSEEHASEAPAREQRHEEPLHTHDHRAIEGECSICFEDISSGGTTTWCRAQCRQNFHKDCLETWHASQVADGRRKTCPYW